MLALFLSMAFAGSTICVKQNYTKYMVCVMMDDYILKDGKNCKHESDEINLVWLKQMWHPDAPYEGFYQCTWCVKCD